MEGEEVLENWSPSQKGWVGERGGGRRHKKIVLKHFVLILVLCVVRVCLCEIVRLLDEPINQQEYGNIG